MSGLERIYLLVEVLESDADHDLRLCGRSWKRKTFPIVADSTSSIKSQVPPFVCVSYVWGSGRLPNPLENGQRMSDRTLESLESAMVAYKAQAYWIDAFCVPVSQPERSLSLESLGYIFNVANAVVAVLGESTATALERMKVTDKLDEDILSSFEEEQWIKSVWTYQEVVNSRQLYLTSRGSSLRTGIEGARFLNRIGYSLSEYKKAHQLNGLAIRRTHPALDAFEDLIADWQIAEYGDRSILQVMSNLDRRVAERPTNYYYALLGSISAEPSKRAAGNQITELAAKIMQTCEAKEDFSFLYAPLKRSTEPRNRWRPLPAALRSILSWHVWSSPQHGRMDASGLWLNKIVIAHYSEEMSKDGEVTVARWLESLAREGSHRDTTEQTIQQLADTVYQCLVQMDFTGSKKFVQLEDGFFFPEWIIGEDRVIEVLIATEIRWTFGAPGLARVKVEGDWQYAPGVFFGHMRNESAQDVLL